MAEFQKSPGSPCTMFFMLRNFGPKPLRSSRRGHSYSPPSQWPLAVVHMTMQSTFMQ